MWFKISFRLYRSWCNLTTFMVTLGLANPARQETVFGRIGAIFGLKRKIECERLTHLLQSLASSG